MNNRENKFYVITGGPGVGKTTLIKELIRNGFQTVEEDARKIIQNQIKTQKDGLPWKNKELYARFMLEASIKSYEKVNKENNPNFIFFDRGIIDTICYMKMEQISISQEMIQLVKQYAYNRNVFILPPWKEIYKTDDERKQSWDEAEYTYSKMNETYLEFGYHTILVPKLERKERMKFIVQQINKSK